MTTIERFWNKVRKTDNCWLWEGAGAQSNRYGLFWYEGRLQCAHRVSFKIMVSDIPKGFELDHLCKNTHCVNPNHLEIVTPSQNQRRSSSPTGKNAAKTHCKWGHPFDEQNTYSYLRNDKPARGCRTCRKAINYRLLGKHV